MASWARGRAWAVGRSWSMSNFRWVKLRWPDGTEYELVLEKNRSQAELGNLQFLYDVELTPGEDRSPEEDRLWEAMRTARIERRQRALSHA